MKPTCGTCRFCKRLQDSKNDGECYALPPRGWFIDSYGPLDSGWDFVRPKVHLDDPGCIYWQPNWERKGG